jgi:hypothetical protein
MKRTRVFDPPEYLNWTPDPALVRQFKETVGSDPARAKIIAALSGDQLVDLYRRLLRARLHDIGLKRWVRQGVISKAWWGRGKKRPRWGRCLLSTPRGFRRAHDPERVRLLRYGDALSTCSAATSAPQLPSRGRDLHIGAPQYM